MQALATFSLVFLGPAPAWIALLLVATFVGGEADAALNVALPAAVVLGVVVTRKRPKAPSLNFGKGPSV
ncbi:hypothetical protein [Amycolatopsis acidicola]|uniref:hypothetical protein n=1 Tax=Amycolatopsis acidicola TaxID=2596893 RepID=UPI001AA072CD|nr:hypothetical protein [Amycolatopsis acidicola]